MQIVTIPSPGVKWSLLWSAPSPVLQTYGLVWHHETLENKHNPFYFTYIESPITNNSMVMFGKLFCCLLFFPEIEMTLSAKTLLLNWSKIFCSSAESQTQHVHLYTCHQCLRCCLRLRRGRIKKGEGCTFLTFLTCCRVIWRWWSRVD